MRQSLNKQSLEQSLRERFGPKATLLTYRKRRDPDLYRRRLRELIGYGECIMGLTDSYPDR
jgi:hypothetical protein